MKTSYLPNILFLSVVGLLFLGFMTIESNSFSIMNNKNTQKQDSLLRHIVLFKFKEDTTKEDLTAIENAFAELPAKIPEIVDFEWGTNNSPEGLDKGFTHSFFVSFKDEKGREVYLPHPDHKAFVELAGPSIEDVLVIDYWAK